MQWIPAGLVAVIATAVPAWRVERLDPATALRLDQARVAGLWRFPRESTG